MLFDKNGFYMPDNVMEDYDFAIDIMDGMPALSSSKPNTMNLNLFNPDEALTKGNAFPNLYDPYKNYKPTLLKVENQREKALLDIQMLEFSINDLNLYLDLHPDDKRAYAMFKSYIESCKKKKDEYAKIYGPLTLDDVTDEYEWSKGVWPWEEGGM